MLARFFFQVMETQDYGSTLQILAGLMVTGVALKLWCRAGDLLMPRPVVLLALVPVAAACAVAALGLLLVEKPLGIRMSKIALSIVAFPLFLFVLRAWFILRVARFAPPLDKLRPGAAAPGARLATKIREIVSFWWN